MPRPKKEMFEYQTSKGDSFLDSSTKIDVGGLKPVTPSAENKNILLLKEALSFDQEFWSACNTVLYGCLWEIIY